MSRDRIDSSVPALVKRGFIGLMQIGEIDSLVIAWREVNVAQHLSAVGTFALDANCEGGTLSLPTQDSAKTKRRVDLVSGYRHPCRIRPITRARRVFRVSANNREVVFSEHLCCERRERYNAQHSGRNHLFSPSHCTLLPRAHCIVLLQSEAVRLVPHALAETASHPDWGGRCGCRICTGSQPRLSTPPRRCAFTAHLQQIIGCRSGQHQVTAAAPRSCTGVGQPVRPALPIRIAKSGRWCLDGFH